MLLGSWIIKLIDWKYLELSHIHPFIFATLITCGMLLCCVLMSRVLSSYLSNNLIRGIDRSDLIQVLDITLLLKFYYWPEANIICIERDRLSQMLESHVQRCSLVHSRHEITLLILGHLKHEVTVKPCWLIDNRDMSDAADFWRPEAQSDTLLMLLVGTGVTENGSLMLDIKTKCREQQSFYL